MIIHVHMVHTYLDSGIASGTNSYVSFYSVKTGTSAKSGSSSRCHSDSMYETVEILQPALGMKANGKPFRSKCLHLYADLLLFIQMEISKEMLSSQVNLTRCEYFTYHCTWNAFQMFKLCSFAHV